MRIFIKRGYGDGHYGTLPNGYPLPSLCNDARSGADMRRKQQDRTQKEPRQGDVKTKRTQIEHHQGRRTVVRRRGLIASPPQHSYIGSAGIWIKGWKKV